MKKNIITFVEYNELANYPPAPAKTFIPDWYKKLESYVGGKKTFDINSHQGQATAKKCMPLFDAITSGYIMFSSVDYFFRVNELGQQEYSYASSSDAWIPINMHHPETLGSYPNLLSPTYRMDSPWTIKTPKGYSIIVLNLLHRENNVFRIFEAIVDTDNHPSPVNFPFTLLQPNFEGVIPAGTPFAQIIPFKRENWKMTISKLSSPLQKELYRGHHKLKASFWNFYRNQVWNRKHFE
jgi:hypothetical protein